MSITQNNIMVYEKLQKMHITIKFFDLFIKLNLYALILKYNGNTLT